MNNIKEYSELSIEDLKNVTWSNVNCDFVGLYNNEEIRTHQFYVKIDGYSPLYIKEVNVNKYSGITALAQDPTQIEEFEKLALLSDYHNTIKKAGVVIEDGNIKYIDFKFTEYTLYIYNKDLDKILLTITNKKS